MALVGWYLLDITIAITILVSIAATLMTDADKSG